MLSKFLILAQVVQLITWQTFKEIPDKTRIVFQNDVHFVINCFLYCRLFVLIVQFHFADQLRQHLFTCFGVHYILSVHFCNCREQKDLLMESSKLPNVYQKVVCSRHWQEGWVGALSLPWQLMLVISLLPYNRSSR